MTLADTFRDAPWVLDLLIALRKYEDEHPPLYRMGDLGTDGVWKYERTQCASAAMSQVPREVWDVVEVIEQDRRERMPSPGPVKP